MHGIFDPIAVADELAVIASTTHDPETATKLMDLVRRLLGVSPDDDSGGGEPPHQWVSDPICSAA